MRIDFLQKTDSRYMKVVLVIRGLIEKSSCDRTSRTSCQSKFVPINVHVNQLHAYFRCLQNYLMHHA